MTDPSAVNSQPVNDGASQPSDFRTGINRREALRRGSALTGAAGAAWAAPMVFDSFANPAAAAGTSLFSSPC